MSNDEFNPYEYHDFESARTDASVLPLEFEEGEITDQEPRTPIEISLKRRGFISSTSVLLTVHRHHCEVSGGHFDEPLFIVRDDAPKRIKITKFGAAIRNENKKRLVFQFGKDRDMPLKIARWETWMEDPSESKAEDAFQAVFHRMKRRIFYTVFHNMSLITILCFCVTAWAVGIILVDIDSMEHGMVLFLFSFIYAIPFLITLFLTIGLWRLKNWALPVGFFLSLIPTFLLAVASILVFPILFFLISAAVSWSLYTAWRDNERLTEILHRDNENNSKTAFPES